jgi:hypothetical protein
MAQSGKAAGEAFPALRTGKPVRNAGYIRARFLQ